ncbi:hypothetical protein [Micromonospora sp. CA-248212]|uniref:hypothetical protein n=1 Tax=Micromonospora sp. CA-248212 TaxID=3239961 RepID=UPI003D8FB3E5
MTTTAPRTRGSGHGLTYAMLGWAVAYGGLRLVWTVGPPPEFPPFGSDLLGFTGWRSVALCLVAGAVTVALDRTATWRPALAGLAWIVAGALVAAAAILLPELVSLLLFAPGPSFDPVAFASRLGCATGAALLGLAVFDYQRRTRGDCPRLLPHRPTRPPTLDARAVGTLGGVRGGGRARHPLRRAGRGGLRQRGAGRLHHRVGDRSGAGRCAVAAGAGAPLG